MKLVQDSSKEESNLYRMPNEFLQTDKIMLSCFLQKSQKTRQHAFPPLSQES